MKVLMISWEYPPKKVGGLATHVQHLSDELATLGVEVHVLSCSFPGKPEMQRLRTGLVIHRVDVYNFPSPDFLSWAMSMNHSLLEYGSRLAGREHFDVIHAHEWMILPCAFCLRYLADRPLVYSIHSTEYGRRNGLPSDFSRTIHECEGWGSFEASKIIVCSSYMRDHVRWLFNTPDQKIVTIPNGVIENPVRSVPFEFRRIFADDNERIILFVGRLVHEKGLGVLIGAIPYLLKDGTKVKLIVIGDGYAADEMKKLAWDLGIYDKVYFRGYVTDEELHKALKIADVLSVPSLFEPFGIVTLEGMISGTPVVVSDVGGLSEIVRHEVNGLKVRPNDSLELASSLKRVLTENQLRSTLVRNALEDATAKYSWHSIAKATLDVYEKSVASS